MITKEQLLEIKDVTEENADLILGIIAGTIDPLEVSAKARYLVNTCHNDPEVHVIKLFAINDILHFYGVECEYDIEYCNAGDTYALTVMYVKGYWKVSTLGDEIE